MDKQLPVSVWPEWKIIEKIGEGSFGKVYKAQRTVNGKVFYSAIKIITIPSSQSELNSIRSESENDQSAREYFKNLVDECIQEVSTMEYFRGNSHVVSVEDYKVVEYLDDIGWDIYIRMEYLTSFLDFCAGKQLKEEEIVQLGIDLCKALECCQKLNIIHRDIKPENIFVSRFGEFKLGDFGIARELERSMSGLSKKGTYSYMAPEMYRGEPYDHKVDIYSLGLVLYKLRNNNRMPFMSLDKQLITYRDKEMALAKRMSDEKMQPPVQAGEGLAQIILKACSYKKEDRYESAEDFRKDLERVKEGKAVQIEKKKKQPEIKEAGLKDVMSDDVLKKQSVQNKESVQNLELAQDTRQTQAAKSLQNTKQKQNTKSAQNNLKKIDRSRRKRNDGSQKPLWAAVIVMSVAVILLTVMFVKLMLDEANYEKGNTIIIEESENQELAEDLTVIRQYANTIESDLPLYNWIGSEEYGQISYLDQEAQVMKVVIYPSASKDKVHEEYYYWDEELFFAYIWAEETSNHYYYVDGQLVRWIDQKNRCHDGETENSEYVERGIKYFERAQEYLNELQS